MPPDLCGSVNEEMAGTGSFPVGSAAERQGLHPQQPPALVPMVPPPAPPLRAPPFPTCTPHSPSLLHFNIDFGEGPLLLPALLFPAAPATSG